MAASAGISSSNVDLSKKKREFYSDLEQYYRRKWNATLRLPYMNGRPVDLFALYQKVTSLGGFSKVSSTNRWTDVTESVNIPTGCAGSEHAVKTIYMRYLSKYEQLQLFGENEGDNGDMPGSSMSLGGGIGGLTRSQRGQRYLSTLGGQQAAGVSSPRFASNILPDFFQSGFPQTSSSTTGAPFSNELDAAHCERLIRSLKCGLPNEVDFAMNVCLLLSNSPKSASGQVALRLNHTPILIDLLLAHAGIFDRGLSSFRSLYDDAWRKYHDTERDFDAFWSSVIEADEDTSRLLLSSYGRRNQTAPSSSSSSSIPSGVAKDIFPALELFPKEKLIIAKRVNQVAHILRNFSFEPECRSAMASNRILIKFLLLSINSQNVELQSNALDILSNIASEIDLEEVDPPLLRVLMDTISRLLHSDDKFHVIRVLESIGCLCTNEKNEPLLCDYLEPVVIRRMIALLAVKDIMMCVYLLECLYQMTELGPIPCQRIAELPRAVDTLVQLVTVEAVSFGPNGLFGMKVIEYGMPAPHTAILPQPHRASQRAYQLLQHQLHPPRLQQQQPQTMDPSLIRSASVSRHDAPMLPVVQAAAHSIHQQAPPPPFLARPVRPVVSNALPPPPPISATPIRAPAGITNLNMKKEQPLSSTIKVPTANKHSPVHRGPAAVAFQQDPHLEQLTTNWLRQHCAIDPGCHVSRGELYTSYMNDMSSVHGSSGVLVPVFTDYIRKMFPSCSIRQLETTPSNGSAGGTNCRTSALLQFDGLRFTPKMMVKINSISPASATTTATPTPPPTSSSSSSQVAAQHPLMQQILSGGASEKNSTQHQQPTKSPGSSSATSALAAAIRARSNSAGTMDSGYSLPGTPDSLSSGFSGTNSSSNAAGLLLGPTNFAGQHLSQQQQQSPKSSKKMSASTIGGKKSPRKSPAAGATTAATIGASGSSGGTMVVDNNGLVNGRDSISSTASASSGGGGGGGPICHLEVCHPAQEARTVIETGDNHEARIVRVENTVAMVSSQFYIPDKNHINSSSNSPSPLPPIGVIVDGDNSTEDDVGDGGERTTKPMVNGIGGESEHNDDGTTTKMIEKETTGGDSRSGDQADAKVNSNKTKSTVNDGNVRTNSPLHDIADREIQPSESSIAENTVGKDNSESSGGTNIDGKPQTESSSDGVIDGNHRSDSSDAKIQPGDDDTKPIDGSKLVDEHLPTMDSVGISVESIKFAAPSDSSIAETSSQPVDSAPTPTIPNDVSASTVADSQSSSIEEQQQRSPKKRSHKKKVVDVGETPSTPTSAAKKPKKSTPKSINGLVKSIGEVATAGSTEVSTDSIGGPNGSSSPSPDTLTMSQNVTQSAQEIQELLSGGANSSDVASSSMVKKEEKEDAVDNTSSSTTPKTAKKTAARKRKSTTTTDSSAIKQEPIESNETKNDDEQPLPAPPPKKKKKYYPKKKKGAITPASTTTMETPQKIVSNMDDSFSQASTSSAHSTSSAAPGPAANSNFRQPLPPTVVGAQSPHVIVQQQGGGMVTVIHQQQQVVRIPTPNRLQYFCEWDGCGQSFQSANSVYFHAAKTHINEESRVCRWTNCDQTPRLRWSLVAHVQDIHCNEHSLRMTSARRYEIGLCGHSNIPEVRAPPPHPGYPPDAAIVAIRRHALVNLAKEIVDESEGPVTKSIRLTSSLILRNLARYSLDGRRILRKHERHLSYLAFSRLESASALSQCLAELNYTASSSSASSSSQSTVDRSMDESSASTSMDSQ